jgi:hypothetical protein
MVDPHSEFLYGYDMYHQGVNYEIAYRVFQYAQTVVIVILVGTRENFYEELKRLL